MFDRIKWFIYDWWPLVALAALVGYAVQHMEYLHENQVKCHKAGGQLMRGSSGYICIERSKIIKY